MANFFLTGTAGFVGFHLARRLLAEGHAVTGFDAVTPYYDVALKRARLKILADFATFDPVEAALEDLPALRAAADRSGADVFIHLAAQAGVRYSLEAPRAYIDANLVGSFNLLEVARALSPRHLLLASSSSVYGARAAKPFLESDRADQPLSLYGATKRSMETMAHAYAHLHGIPTTALRLFTVYGPWGRPDMALFKFVDAILNERTFEVYGEGKMLRDFTYIDDVVELIWRLIPLAPNADQRRQESGTESPQAPYRVLNCGGGQPVPLMDFVAAVEKALGKKAQYRLVPMQAGDVPVTYSGSDALQALTGFRPETPIAEGVARFVAWYRDYFGLAGRV